MLSITEQFIETAAPNADAAKNGKGLVLKNKFLTLHHSADECLLFGACQGSGQQPYPYLPGAQSALHNYTRLFYSDMGEEKSAKERESVYSESL